MKTIRTTITLPEDLHEKLRQKAFQYKKSFNEVVVGQLREKPEKEYFAKSTEQRVHDTLVFFNEVSRMGKKIDVVKAIREDRDRDEI